MEEQSQSSANWTDRQLGVPVTILVVEDDECFRTALTDALREDGHRVEAFANPSEVPLQRVGHVDLVVTGYRMPEQNGLEFADAFHALHPRVPVILITGDTSRFVDTGVSRRPFTTLRRKPLGYEDLRKVIDHVCGSHGASSAGLQP